MKIEIWIINLFSYYCIQYFLWILYYWLQDDGLRSSKHAKIIQYVLYTSCVLLIFINHQKEYSL